MALMRQNPVPPGKYWIDLHGPLSPGSVDSRKEFAKWVAITEGNNPGVLRILTTNEELRSTGAFSAPIGFNFITFQVLQPVPWPKEHAINVGYPTIIEKGQNIQTSKDVVSRPTQEQIEEGVRKDISDFTSALVAPFRAGTGAIGSGVLGGIGPKIIIGGGVLAGVYLLAKTFAQVFAKKLLK